MASEPDVPTPAGHAYVGCESHLGSCPQDVLGTCHALISGRPRNQTRSAHVPTPAVSAEVPLRERVAVALGWTRSTLPALSHRPGPVAWRSPDGRVEGVYLPPYGDDTPEGWACTGPLIELFKLTLEYVADGCDEEAPPCWRVIDHECEDVALGDTACAAVAEWVAQFAAHHAAQAKETR